MTAKDHANPIGCPYCDGKSYGMGPEAREQYKKYHDNGHSWVISKDHAGGVPPTQIREAIAKKLKFWRKQNLKEIYYPLDDIMGLLIAEYKQLLNELPKKYAKPLNGPITTHEAEKGMNYAIDQCRAIIEARIKELE